jgi:hypothetical protein
VLSEAGAGLSSPGKSFTVYIDYVNNAISRYTVANFGDNPASIILTLNPHNSSGASHDGLGDPTAARRNALWQPSKGRRFALKSVPGSRHEQHFISRQKGLVDCPLSLRVFESLRWLF